MLMLMICERDISRDVVRDREHFEQTVSLKERLDHLQPSVIKESVFLQAIAASNKPANRNCAFLRKALLQITLPFTHRSPASLLYTNLELTPS